MKKSGGETFGVCRTSEKGTANCQEVGLRMLNSMRCGLDRRILPAFGRL